MNPYRAVRAPSARRAPTSGGEARLQCSPGAVVIELADQERLTVTHRFAMVERFNPKKPSRKPKRFTADLDGRFVVAARSHPSRDLGVWIEERPGRVRRIFGLGQVDLSGADPMAAWRQLDRLTATVEDELRRRGHDSPEALELGSGGHRVLLLDRGDRAVLYTRPVFRERPRRIFELREDGAAVIGWGSKRVSIQVRRSRFDVVSSGDRILLGCSNGPDRALFLPWIGEPDRDELARRFGELLERRAPPAGSNRRESFA